MKDYTFIRCEEKYLLNLKNSLVFASLGDKIKKREIISYAML